MYIFNTINVIIIPNIFINEFNNILELKEVISEYVNKYNNKRFHSSIGYKKPMNVYLEALKNAA